MTIFELAQKYYPTLWNKERLHALVENDPPRLTPEEYKQITGEDYTTATPTETA